MRGEKVGSVLTRLSTLRRAALPVPRPIFTRDLPLLTDISGVLPISLDVENAFALSYDCGCLLLNDWLVGSIKANQFTGVSVALPRS